MKITGKIEIFRNKNGFITGFLKSFNGNQCTGKVFIDVTGLDIKDERTYTIEVEDGYLNVVHVETLTRSFDKLSIAVKKHKLLSVYPEKPSDRINNEKTKREEDNKESVSVSDDDVPF